jgi:hypothetical protein
MNGGLFDLLGSPMSTLPTSNTQARPTMGQIPSPARISFTQPQPQGMGMGVPMGLTSPSVSSRPSYTATNTSAPPVMSPSATTTKTGAGAFDDLWTASLSTVGGNKTSAQAQSKSIGQMEKEQAMTGLWGPSPSQGSGAQGASKPLGGTSSGLSGLDDLLL